MRVILGLSAYYHDSAAALLVDGRPVAAAQEERFSRRKHDDRFPAGAVKWCLAHAGLTVADIDAVVFYEKPFLKFERLMLTHLQRFPAGFRSFLAAIPTWMKDKLWMKSLIRRELGQTLRAPILFNEHHMSHAASAFLCSPFDEAAILTVDGVGEWSTSTWGTGRGTSIELTHETRFPHSLGLLYSAYTAYLGFKVNSAEYKVMGLAPYGRPNFVEQVRKTVDWKPDGSFRLATEYFDYLGGLRMTNARFHDLFGGPPRAGESRLTQREFDIAASIQTVTDDIMLALARHVRAATGLDRLCMAGGVALNCVANAKVLRGAGFRDLWIQPAAGDAGGALGAALHLWNGVLGNPRTYTMHHAMLGPEYGAEETRAWLDAAGAKYTAHLSADGTRDDDALTADVAARIAGGQVVGWHQGAMEFGPRALGGRSILADPRDPEMKDTLNRKIKFREGFRPFAPSVTEEDAPDWFDMAYAPAPPTAGRAGDPERPDAPPAHTSPFMLLVADVIPGRTPIPSVTHVDGSARLQTVARDTHPLYHSLIARFGALTGVPVIINTSFNVRGEPIVNTPADAYRCFMRTNMDALAVGPFVLTKSDQPPWTEDGDWRREFALD